MDIKSTAINRSIETEDNEICIAGTEFQCDETKCILSTQVCDGIVDCLDNTDERDCENVHEGWCAPHKCSKCQIAWRVPKKVPHFLQLNTFPNFPLFANLFFLT